MLIKTSSFFAAFVRVFARAFLVCAVFLSCALESEDNPWPANSKGTRAFNVYNAATKAYYQVNAEEKYSGAHCIIYTDVKTASGLSGADVKEIGEEYDNGIHEKITGAFGDVLDVDGNGKIILLLLDIQDGYKAGSASGYLGGYFSAYDMLNKSVSPHSNEADMLYIDINPQTPKSEAFYSTIAHELQHLINYSQTEAKGTLGKEAWINEGLSTAAEYLWQETDPCRRVYSALMTNYPEYFGVSPNAVQQQETFFLWENHLENYAQDFLFFQWLRIHAKDGKNIYKRILDAPQSSFEAVLSAVNDSNGIEKSINNNANWTWQSLLRAWFASNYLYNSNFPGYKSESIVAREISKFNTEATQSGKPSVNSLMTPWKGWQGQTKTIPLKNGQGVLVTYTGVFTQTSNITYTGIQSNGVLINSSFTSGMAVIVFNYDSSTTGTSISAALPAPSSVLSAPASRMAGESFGPFLPIPAGVIDVIIP